MPPGLRSTEAPALFLAESGEDRVLVNYRVRGEYYVVDKLFEEAVLVVGVGRHAKQVKITRGRRGGPLGFLFDWGK